MTQAGSLLAELDRATRRWHAAADEPWLALLREGVTRRDYIDLLVRMHGFEAPLEAACAYTPQLWRTVEMRRLTRAGRIAQDLLALGMTPSELAGLPQCFSITTFKDVAEALGWLYVVERTTQYHVRVRRHLLRHLDDVRQACAYLSMLDDAPEHGDRFGRSLDRLLLKGTGAMQVIDAAHAGFACMEQWLSDSAPRLRSAG